MRLTSDYGNFSIQNLMQNKCYYIETNVFFVAITVFKYSILNDRLVEKTAVNENTQVKIIIVTSVLLIALVSIFNTQYGTLILSM